MMRMVSAIVRLALDGGFGERKREADPSTGTAIWSIEHIEPTAVSFYEPSADEESKARARNARLAHVPGAVERFRDETAFRLRHPDALVIYGDGQPRPIDPGTDHDRTAVRGVLARIADEVRQHLADAPDVDIER